MPNYIGNLNDLQRDLWTSLTALNYLVTGFVLRPGVDVQIPDVVPMGKYAVVQVQVCSTSLITESAAHTLFGGIASNLGVILRNCNDAGGVGVAEPHLLPIGQWQLFTMLFWVPLNGQIPTA